MLRGAPVENVAITSAPWAHQAKNLHVNNVVIFLIKWHERYLMDIELDY